MKLRYIVESKHAKTFTVTKKAATHDAAIVKVQKLKNENNRMGYTKYSKFELYHDTNIKICNL